MNCQSTENCPAAKNVATTRVPGCFTPPSLRAAEGTKSDALLPPTERDLNVYKRSKIWRHPQWEIATDLKVHYSRVSQIVKKVERWLAAGGSPNDPAIRDHAARQRLSKATHKLRLMRAIELATAAMEAEPEPQVTTRRRTVHGQEVFFEETTRPSPPVNLSAVRLLVRATEALERFEDRGKTEEPSQPVAEPNFLPAVFDYLCRCRLQAESAGCLPATADVETLVATALDSLLGTTLAAPPVPPTEEAVGRALPAAADEERAMLTGLDATTTPAPAEPPPTEAAPPSNTRTAPAIDPPTERLLAPVTTDQPPFNLSAAATNTIPATDNPTSGYGDSPNTSAEKNPDLEHSTLAASDSFRPQPQSVPQRTIARGTESNESQNLHQLPHADCQNESATADC